MTPDVAGLIGGGVGGLLAALPVRMVWPRCRLGGWRGLVPILLTVADPDVPLRTSLGAAGLGLGRALRDLLPVFLATPVSAAGFALGWLGSAAVAGTAASVWPAGVAGAVAGSVLPFLWRGRR